MEDTYFQCERCREGFAIKARRGRPPKHCDECKKNLPTKAEIKRQLAQKRVDRLTDMLEMQGKAISQHSGDPTVN